jgi:hypothetical protein
MQQTPIRRRASAQTPYQSSNPQRAGFHGGLHPEDQPSTSTELEEEEDDSYFNTRLPSSARRYQTTGGSQLIEQGNRRLVIHQGPPPRAKRRTHWSWLFAGGMVVMLALFIGFQLLGNWWSQHQIDTAYGFPRIYQTDAVVYPGDTFTHPSHYLFLNLNGTVEIIEFPHGNAAHARVYTGPTLYAENADQIPVTGSFTNVSGREEMIVHIQERDIVYVNDGKQFIPQR